MKAIKAQFVNDFQLTDHAANDAAIDAAKLTPTEKMYWDGIQAEKPYAVAFEMFRIRFPKAAIRQRLFSGVFPCGIVYADRAYEVAGDYKRLAFLSYRTLELEIENDCPAFLREAIQKDAANIQAQRGQQFQITTSGQTVSLGQ